MKTRRTSSSAITTKNLLLISTCGAASPTPFASIIVSNISFISTRNSSLISSGSTGTATCLKTSSPSFVILNIYFLKLITIYSLPPLVVIPAFLVLPAIGRLIYFSRRILAAFACAARPSASPSAPAATAEFFIPSEPSFARRVVTVLRNILTLKPPE